MKGSFTCENCGREVSLKALGTSHRNHCPFCLWSKHLDNRSGDRKAFCGGLMTPIALTFKHEGIDKFTGKPRQGEIMIIHQCIICGKISLNRIAGDDLPSTILKIFKNSLKISSNLKDYLKKQGIEILTKNDEKEIRIQLYGNFSKTG